MASANPVLFHVCTREAVIFPWSQMVRIIYFLLVHVSCSVSVCSFSVIRRLPHTQCSVIRVYIEEAILYRLVVEAADC